MSGINHSKLLADIAYGLLLVGLACVVVWLASQTVAFLLWR